MRKIEIDVPKHKCLGCRLIFKNEMRPMYKACPFRADWQYQIEDLKPVKECKNSTVI